MDGQAGEVTGEPQPTAAGRDGARRVAGRAGGRGEPQAAGPQATTARHVRAWPDGRGHTTPPPQGASARQHTSLGRTRIGVRVVGRLCEGRGGGRGTVAARVQSSPSVSVRGHGLRRSSIFFACTPGRGPGGHGPGSAPVDNHNNNNLRWILHSLHQQELTSCCSTDEDNAADGGHHGGYACADAARTPGDAPRVRGYRPGDAPRTREDTSGEKGVAATSTTSTTSSTPGQALGVHEP
jgi:hypothetical protein